jgi:predicted anti-sigma-YlaC factor YlaD
MAVSELHPTGCERAREWASLGLDGELSEFERALLRAHLDRCASCSAYAERVTHATAELRRAPLVPLAAQVELPRRRSRVLPLRAIQVASATAALAAAVGLGAVLGAHSSHPSSSLSVRASAGAEAIAEDKLIREPRLAMINAQKGIGTQRGIGIVDF